MQTLMKRLTVNNQIPWKKISLRKVIGLQPQIGHAKWAVTNRINSPPLTRQVEIYTIF